MGPYNDSSFDFFDAFDVNETVTSAKNDSSVTVGSLVDSFFSGSDEHNGNDE